MKADESRQRFEKWCSIKIIDASKAPKTAALKSAFWTAWQAAERDTRELCAQLCEQRMAFWRTRLVSCTAIERGAVERLLTELEQLAERIRGKGEAL